MKHLLFAFILMITTDSANADGDSSLRAEMKSLQFLVGACWAGQFPDGKRTDVHCFESVFAGMHLRDRHVVSGGSALYQGETIYSWNNNAKQIEYVYWNSYGGVSTGAATPGTGKIAFPDESYVGSNGKTIVISSIWENFTDEGYDSLSIETHPNGETKKRRVRYQKTTDRP
ncbi:MAG: hypothetical protein ACR2P1_22775 [Pseudomonadales bacterium]